MRITPYVTPEEAALSRYMETKLLDAPLESGILFAGVRVEVILSDLRGHERFTVYHVSVGVDRDLIEDVKIVDMMVQSLLKVELPKGSRLSIQALRGQSRKLLTPP